MSQYIKVPQGDSTKLSAPLCISSKSKAMGCSQQRGSYLRFHGEKGDVGKSYAKGKILVSHFFPSPKFPSGSHWRELHFNHAGLSGMLLS